MTRYRKDAIITIAFGETRSVTEWARDPRCVVNLTTLRYRILQGWSTERAMTTSPQSGRGDDPVYRVWLGIRNRCSDPNGKNWHRYGGRGISVCEEWRDDFLTFRTWAYTNGYQSGLQIDRIDNDGNYEPSNCRWATPKQNARNSSRPTPLTAFGETKPMSEWTEDARCMTNYSTLRSRVQRGWDHQRAITTPSRRMRR